tara:strand:- start:4301 stop:5911 length:1611 start_codon:yes stop_codon:yes gene_type:complete
MTEEQMYDLLVQNGMDPLQAKSKAVEYMQDPELVQTLLETSPTDQLADGGRVGMNTGGNPSYQEIVDKIMASYPKGTEQDIKRREPQLEALIQAFGPQLAATLGTPLNPMTGGTNVSGQKYGAYAPTSANQNALQQASINQALKQAGYDTLPASAFDATGQLKPGASLTGSGIGAYQQFLNQAGIDAAGASAAAKAGQGAGAAGIAQAQTMAGLMGGQALAGQNAGAQQLANAQQQANLMSQAALAGQGAGDANFAAAQGYTGPQAYQQFMSPYQQEVIDATMQDYQQELAKQQSQLGLGAGSAFGGSRFGVAQGELGAQGAQGMASTLANLRQQGFGQANQLAAQAAQQQMGLGQAAQQQAAQNVGLFGQGLQGQQSQAAQMQNQIAQNMGLYGQAGQAALGGAGAAQQQAAQNVGLYGQTGQMQTGLASLQPQLAAQNIGLLGQMGTQQQQQDQARRDTLAQANKMVAFEPYDRMGFFGQQVTGIGGGYPGQTQYSTQAMGGGVSPMMQLFGVGATALGGLGNLANTFGFGGPK